MIFTPEAGESTRRHEFQHVLDSEQLGWVAFAAAYATNGLVHVFGGESFYADNRFEMRGNAAGYGQAVAEWGWEDIFGS
jgi:hypothetical protein